MKPRVTLRVGRVVSDRPLGRESLEAALRAEIEALLAEAPAALGPGRALARLTGRLDAAPAEPGAPERAVARATVGALRR
jgi:hypothetical protein